MQDVSNIHKTFVLVIFMLVGLIGYSQESMLEVASFSLEENSLTAKNEPVRDTNNQKCALVIISGFGNESLRFNVGNTFSKVEEKRDDRGKRVYLLWIPEGTVKVTISSDSKSFAPVEYFFNPRVKRAETYMMELKLSAMKSLAEKQYLEFHVNPENAYLEVNDEPWEIRSGIAYKQLKKGKYNYRAQAKNYYPEAGSVDFQDLSSKQIVEINLKPNFGWLTIISPSELENLNVFIDDEMQTSGLNRIQLSSGRHTIKVSKEMYLPFTQIFDIVDNTESKITPNLIPNFSTANISAAGDASIYIDDKFVGTGFWTGPLSEGSYSIEIKKDNYKTITQTISIPEIGETYNFDYKKLTPILGSVSIESNPTGANVNIDDKDYGKTPVFIPEIIIGNHELTLTLSNHKTLSKEFKVEEGKQIDLLFNLELGNDKIVEDNKANTRPPVLISTNPTSPKNNNSNSKGKKKYGIMDSERVLKSMSEYATLQQQINARTQKAESELAVLHERQNKAYEAYNKKPNKKNSDAVQALNNEIAQFVKSAPEDLKAFQKAEIEKLQSRISYAAKQVGREEGFEVIFPKDVPLYCGADVIDATDIIIKKLK